MRLKNQQTETQSQEFVETLSSVNRSNLSVDESLARLLNYKWYLIAVLSLT